MSDDYQVNETMESPSATPAPAEVRVPAISMPSVSVGGATPSPSVISIAEIEASRPSFFKRFSGVMAAAGGLFQGKAWIAGIVLLVGLLGFLLFLPPVSLAQRIVEGNGYVTLDENNAKTEHPDGITVSVTGGKPVRLRLSSVPQANVESDQASADMQAMLQALPQHLTLKSPYYEVAVRKNSNGPARIEVLIPNDAEPWETLGLYAWDGQQWNWLPTQLDRARAVLIADVPQLPGSVAVMQSGMVQQKVVAESLGVSPEGQAVLTGVDVPGMFIGTMGGLTGDATRLTPASQAGALELAPVVRNWVQGRDPNWALVSDMLSLESDRNAHIQNLVSLAQLNGYRGVVVDYRAVRPENRDLYSRFVADLATALHAQNLWLGLMVETPTQSADGTWDTGAYDWSALGAAVDQFRIAMPLNPVAYAAGGAVEQLLEWTIARVDRYKVIPVFDTLSTDGTQVFKMQDLFAGLGTVQPVQAITDVVKPGSSLGFKLGSSVAIEMDDTGASKLVSGDTPKWLGTSQWLRARMDLAARYHLGGVMLRELFDEGNFPDLIPAIADYKAQAPAKPYTAPEILWEVTSPFQQVTQARTSLAQPLFTWVAPQLTGTYRISATVLAMNRGVVEVRVGAPVVLSGTTALTGTSGLTGTQVTPTSTTPAVTPPGDGPLSAEFVTDVSVPDYTHFEKKEAFTKTWRFKNTGNTAWPKDTVLVLTNGEAMGETKQVTVGEVKSGATIDVSVNMTAPDKDGEFKGVWRLQSGGKEIEGGGVMIIIKVGSDAQPTPQATPTPGASTTAPQPVVQPVSGGGFDLGGHVRDLGIPYSDKMHYAGMTWSKVQVHYGEGASELIQIAHAKGFKIQLSALGGASMVTEAGFEQKFAEWVAKLAASGADAIEVWNEPNIDREWQIGSISPAAYTKLLCTAYNAIKSANPNTAVISAAPAPTGWFGGCSGNGCDDQPWMEGLYNAGAAGCMDYIGAHHNAGATSPSARSGHPAGGTHHSWYFLPQTELYFNIFRGTRKLFYTEMGYASQEGVPQFSDQFAWARGITNAQQAAWLSEAVQLGVNTGMVRCIIVWNVDFVRYGYDPQDGFAIIRPGGGCPACDALHNVLGTR